MYLRFSIVTLLSLYTTTAFVTSLIKYYGTSTAARASGRGRTQIVYTYTHTRNDILYIIYLVRTRPGFKILTNNIWTRIISHFPRWKRTDIAEDCALTIDALFPVHSLRAVYCCGADNGIFCQIFTNHARAYEKSVRYCIMLLLCLLSSACVSTPMCTERDARIRRDVSQLHARFSRFLSHHCGRAFTYTEAMRSEINRLELP